MLPDLRFVFGAMLAIAMLAAAGFGFAISIQLRHDAHGSLDPPQSLAGASAQANRFRDLGSAPLFASAARGLEEPSARIGVEAPPALPETPVEEVTSDEPARPAPEPTTEAARAEPTTSAEDSQITPTAAASEAVPAATPPAEPDRVAIPPATETRKDDVPEQLETDFPRAQDPAPAATPARPIHGKPHPRKARVQR